MNENKKKLHTHTHTRTQKCEISNIHQNGREYFVAKGKIRPDKK